MRISDLNNLLKNHFVEIKFSAMAVRDLSGYNRNVQEQIMALIIKRALNGPLIGPKGVGKPLSRELNGFTKLKLKKLNIRVVYKPEQSANIVTMQIIAIGPRDNNLVYRKAAQRLNQFEKEMQK